MEKFIKDLKGRLVLSKTWMEDPDTEADTKLYHEGKIEAYELALRFLEKRSAVRGPAIKMIRDAMKILDGDHDVEEAFARYEKKFAEFEDELANKQDEINGLYKEYEVKFDRLDNQIIDQHEEIEALNQEFGALEDTLTGRNDRIKFLESELARRDSKIEGLLEKEDRDSQCIRRLIGDREALELHIEDQLDRESELRAELEVKEKSIQHLSNIVDHLSSGPYEVSPDIELPQDPLTPGYPWRVILNHPPGEINTISIPKVDFTTGNYFSEEHHPPKEINVVPTPKVEMILDFIDDDPSSPDHRGVWKTLETEKPKRRRFKFGMRR